MKAFYINRSHRLEYGHLPTPKPENGEALIKVKACALNHLDLHILKGRFDIPLPHILGSDVSGIIEKIKGKSNLKVGDEVVINPAILCEVCPRCKKGLSCEIVTILGYKTQGGYAEYITAPLGQVYSKPKNLTFIEAAAFPLTFLTAYHMLVGRAKLQKGETVFIWGASGGLGAAAIQITKYLGAKSITAGSSDQDLKRIKEMGADYVVNYKIQNVVEYVEKITNKERVDVVFESVGAVTWNTSLAILRPHGRVVIAGTTSGAVASQDLSDIYYNQHTILGSRMGTKEEFEEVLKLVESNKLRPTVDKIFPLKEADKALQRMKESKQTGKIVLEVSH